MKQDHAYLWVIITFAMIVLSAPAIQIVVELREGETLQALSLFADAPTVSNLRSYEKELEDDSWLAEAARPWMQYFQFVAFDNAGDKTLRGRDDWFFYKPGVEYLTLRQRADSPTDDPVAAICDFRDRLAELGIHLIVMPAPNKESIYPEKLVGRADGSSSAVCERTEDLFQRLKLAGVDVIDLFQLFGDAKASGGQDGADLYLAQDSHWSPLGVELAAKAVAQRLIEEGWVTKGTVDYEVVQTPVWRVGDVLRMLSVPQIEEWIGPELVPSRKVVLPGGQPYVDDPNSEVLVLGDSFLRIFQEDEPGSAGFIAHLARELGNPVASIVSDGGASTLVRQELHRRPQLLQNKKVVIWEFVERDIRYGTEGWQIVPLPNQPVLAGQ